MVKDSIDVGREHTLVSIVDRHSRVGPPQEGLGQLRAIEQPHIDFQIGAARTQPETHVALLVKHPLHFITPHRDRPVRVLLDVAIHRQISARTVVLRPVELYAAADPRPCQSHQRGLDHVVVIDEMALFQLIVGHLNTSAQFRHHHHLQVLVFQEHHVPLLRCRFVGYRLNDGVRIDHTA